VPLYAPSWVQEVSKLDILVVVRNIPTTN